MTTQEQTQMAAEYAACGNFSAVARRYGVSRSTVQRAVQKHGTQDTACTGSDPPQSEAGQTAPQDTAASLAQHLESRRQTMCSIVDRLLEALHDEEKIAKASLNQVATTLRIFLKELSADDPEEEENGQLQSILKAVQDIA